MSFEAERATIETHFRDRWALSPFAALPIIFDNVNTKQPTGDFIVHRIADSDGRQMEIVGQGLTLHRYTGIVQIDVLVRIGSGTAEARKIADAAADAYRRRQLVSNTAGIITFRAPSLRSLGTVSERFRLVVTCPYHRDVRQ